jgi:rod shape determining protein RodA
MQEQRTNLQRFHVDLPLLIGLVALSGIGLVVLYSAGGESTGLVIRQAIRLSIAFAVMLVLAQIAPRHLFQWSPWLYVIGLLLLIVVLYFGDAVQGAQRWLRFGPLKFQPSELAKLTVPLMVAYFFADRSIPPRTLEVVAAALIVVVPTLLIIRQPDLGTALLIACSGGFVLFLAGLRWRLILGLLIAFAASAPAMWHLLHDYQRRRVLTFFDPEQDPLGAGYHIIQSKIAIGSGGLFGKGWLNGSQGQLEFLPERSTDFIFAVIGEELGLMGVLAILLIYLFIVARGLFIAATAQDTFSRLLAGSISLTFFFYFFVNTAMVTGLLPVVGIPLPLVSAGGTSMVTLMTGFGILMSIQTHRKLLAR